MRLLSMAAVVSLIAFWGWLVQPSHWGHPALFWPLVFAWLIGTAGLVNECLNYSNISVPRPPGFSSTWTVDVFTTWCPGEPRGMVLRTLKAMTHIRYPHTNYLCDEGDDPILREACKRLGIVHLTRQSSEGGKP